MPHSNGVLPRWAVTRWMVEYAGARRRATDTKVHLCHDPCRISARCDACSDHAVRARERTSRAGRHAYRLTEPCRYRGSRCSPYRRHAARRHALLGLKTVNDTLGHAAGDQLLVGGSKLMRQVTPAMDVFARIGGDEDIILADKMDPATAHQTGQRFIDTLSDTSFLLSGTAVTVGASVGIHKIGCAVGPFDLDAPSGQSLVRCKAEGLLPRCIRSRHAGEPIPGR
jgi:hypothetical protein